MAQAVEGGVWKPGVVADLGKFPARILPGDWPRTVDVFEHRFGRVGKAAKLSLKKAEPPLGPGNHRYDVILFVFGMKRVPGSDDDHAGLGHRAARVAFGPDYVAPAEILALASSEAGGRGELVDIL